MTILFLALWLQMSAQAVQIPTCQGCWQIWVATPTALDDITRAEFAEAARRAADETDGKPLCTIDAVTHKISPPECAAEPVDVPAVQETREVDSGPNWCNACAGNWCTAMACGPHKEKQTFETCADKNRILEHDEHSPPKYWCRKVQI